MSADPKKAFLTEAENAIRVYSNLKFLTDSQASDERLWAGLCLGPFWTYVQYRWGIDQKCTVSAVKNHYRTEGWTSFSCQMRCRLKKRVIGGYSPIKNPWELTKFICESSDYIMHALERNTSNDKTLFNIPFLSAIIDVKIRRKMHFSDQLWFFTITNARIYILDCLPEERIYEKIHAKALEISTPSSPKREFRQQRFNKESGLLYDRATRFFY